MLFELIFYFVKKRNRFLDGEVRHEPAPEERRAEAEAAEEGGSAVGVRRLKKFFRVSNTKFNFYF